MSTAEPFSISDLLNIHCEERENLVFSWDMADISSSMQIVCTPANYRGRMSVSNPGIRHAHS